LDRNIIHLHIPTFPITLERLNQPGLRDRPVVIAPPQSDRALILAVSLEARREGIFKGMPIGKALRFCPELTVLPPNPGLVERGSMLLTRAVAEYTPVWEPSKPGHVYLDVTGTQRLWGRAKDAAWRISRDINASLSLSGAVGVAGNKMVSSIASRLLPSGEIMDVDHGRESSFMAPLKMDYLPGIGHVRKRTLLEELNITLVREIAEMDSGNLRLIFKKQAWVIHQRSIGIDPTPVLPPSSEPEVSESVTLDRDINDDERLLGELYSLVEKCARKLRKRGIYPKRAGILIRYSDQMENTRSVPLSTQGYWESELYPVIRKLFFNTCDRRCGVRFMRVRFTDLSKASGQLLLFSKPRPEILKRNDVSVAMDRIRAKYGEEDGIIGYGAGRELLARRRRKAQGIRRRDKGFLTI
jgi:DNA polymerase-4